MLVKVRCQCVICIVARSFGTEVANSKKKRGPPKSKEETITKPTAIKVCSLCYEKIYPGCCSRAVNRCSDDVSIYIELQKTSDGSKRTTQKDEWLMAPKLSNR